MRAPVAFAVVLAACGSTPSRKAETPHAQLAASTPTAPGRGAADLPKGREPVSRRAKLRYELNGRAFSLPVVHGTVAGHETWMLVDTGANSHVIAGWFAKKAGLTLAKLGDVGTDHAGRSIATFRVEHPQVAIDEWGTLAEGPMLVTEVPAIIQKLGIGVFISPQRLTEEGDAVVLDLLAGEIRAAWFDEAMRDGNLPARAIIGDDARACEDTQSPIKGLAYVVPAKVNGLDARLLVDTGAQRSDILAGSVPGKALAPKSVANKEQMYGASGKLTSRTVLAANVTVGNAPMKLDVDVIGGESDPCCPRDGVLSMDVLRKCVLVLGRKRIVGRCAE